MRNIILQHWTGDMNDLTTKSSLNISKYAKKVNAEYRLLRGNVFHPKLTPPCQKIHMLNEAFDEYDVVVMIDADMFTRKGMNDDIFDPNITGIGMHTNYQSKIYSGLRNLFPDLTDPAYPYWGGAIYKLERPIRQLLRSYLHESEYTRFSGAGRYEDEGIMHRLAVLAKLPKCKLPDNNKWCHGSFENGIAKAAMIHIRHKVVDKNGNTIPKPKIEVYQELVNNGLIEE